MRGDIYRLLLRWIRFSAFVVCPEGGLIIRCTNRGTSAKIRGKEKDRRGENDEIDDLANLDGILKEGLIWETGLGVDFDRRKMSDR